MGQMFHFSLYDDQSNKYFHLRPIFSKLGEMAYNDHELWKYIKNNPRRVGFIGDQNERFSKTDCSKEEGHDYGVASVNVLFQSDCAGTLEFGSEFPEVGWTGYLVNHTKKMVLDVQKYYERSRIGSNCIDPLVVLAASNSAATLFWDGFSENTAYSLLGWWFTDIIEWVDDRPENMDELCDLEFCEFFWETMLNEWGTTDDGYLANKDGEIFHLRRNLGLANEVISPAKVKFKIEKTDAHVHCTSEFVPDMGVSLKEENNNRVSFVDSDGNVFKDFKREWFGSAYIKRPSGEVAEIKNVAEIKYS